MSEAAIAKKAEEVKSVNAQLLAAESAIVVDYRGLTVEEVTDLRKQLRDANIKMSVIKNKILERAVEGTDYEDLKATFVGPTAVAFSDEDPIAPAKILKKFADDHDALEIKGGIIEKKVQTLDAINEYATMPGREDFRIARSNAQNRTGCQGRCRQGRRRSRLSVIVTLSYRPLTQFIT